MGNILLIVGGILAAAVVVVLILAWRKPSVFRVVRSTTINAPPAKVFGYLNDFHRWGDWSPWERLDPNLQRTFTGPQSGVGSAYAWEGNKKVGQGRMEITESTAPSKVSLDLQFIKPFKGQNVTDFILEPSGSGTKLTWDMHGPNQCIGRIMQVFCDMDAMIGKDFEQGLSNLKAAAEKR